MAGSASPNSPMTSGGDWMSGMLSGQSLMSGLSGLATGSAFKPTATPAKPPGVGAPGLAGWQPTAVNQNQQPLRLSDLIGRRVY